MYLELQYQEYLEARDHKPSKKQLSDVRKISRRKLEDLKVIITFQLHVV